ncbi:MAG TPA: D-alanyl-D-alanine endopeptidase [Pseudomonadales bacterium]|nr:D-alanyl-D-alanine endopeptidase [Pseudomonadales bacterium]
MMIKKISSIAKNMVRVALLMAGASCAVSVVAGTAVTHTVKNGETLYRIATANNMTVEQLRAVNKLGRNAQIKPGQTLHLYTRVTQKPARKNSASESGVTNTKVIAKIRNQPRSSTVSDRAPVREKTTGGYPQLASGSALVIDAETGQTLFAKNAEQTRSIASITKLMTAMVVLDASQPMSETLAISNEDIDYLKHTSSRLGIGTRLSRYDMLRLALMSSENRAASSLARYYPGGRQAFIRAMNSKAANLGMSHTRFYDSTGLTPSNISTAEDLAKMVRAAGRYDLIHQFSTTPGREVVLASGSALQYRNTNALLRDPSSDWNIQVSKTGYTQEAGRCLVMMATVANRNAVMIMLDSDGKLSPVGDANRLKDWLESGRAPTQLAHR